MGYLQSNPLMVRAISTAMLVLIVLVLQWLIGRAIRSNGRMTKDDRRRWIVQSRNLAVVIVLLGLIVIWAEHVGVVAFSLFGAAVATVIALKELIQCITGSLLKSGGRSFSLGDRIQVDKWRGDVIDHNAFTTTILEVGSTEHSQQLSGRAVVLPNSVFLDKPVINESFTDEYVLHEFSVPVKMSDTWQETEEDLLAAATQETSQHLEQAREHFKKLAENQGISKFGVDPRVTVHIPKAGELTLTVRVAVPARKKGPIEQAILRRFLELTAARTTKKKDAEPAETKPPAENSADSQTATNEAQPA